MKTTVFAIFLLISAASAQEATEEAIILNEELQFLEDQSTKTGPMLTSRMELESRPRDIQVDSLEKRYFGEESDRISIQTSAIKKRR